MAQASLGRTIIIANPASHSGKGAAAAERTQRFFEAYTRATTSFEMHLTAAPLDAVELAKETGGTDTVIALGGDGLIHEVVNGLMAIDEARRPRLGIIPMGSGNDFARTLGVSFNNPDRALAELLAGSMRTLDLGRVVSDAVPFGPAGTEGTYFMETLSFGLDAAVAIDTTRRREAGTRQEGSALFLTSSIRLVSEGSKGWRSSVRINHEDPIDLQTLMFAVQLGPTYGGGFRICPTADPSDGLLSLCYNVRKPSVPHLLVLLALARFGLHTHSRIAMLRNAMQLELDFPDAEPPCQVDGEKLVGTHFEVDLVPQALKVIAPRTRA